MTTSEPNTITTTKAGYHNTSKEQDYDLKFHLMKRIESYNEEINKTLKEILESTMKHVHSFKEETNESFK